MDVSPVQAVIDAKGWYCTIHPLLVTVPPEFSLFFFFDYSLSLFAEMAQQGVRSPGERQARPDPARTEKRTASRFYQLKSGHVRDT